ncbi:MAG TPA: ROK family protein [Noviherbaspirillum sp.]
MDTGFIAALDIGGTKIAAVIAGPQGPLARTSEPTVKTGTVRALPQQCLSLIEATCARASIDPQSLTALGVASAGPFVHEQGLLGLSTPNICGARSPSADLPNDWDVIPLEAVLRERFDRIVIENDCVSALIAERTFGALVGEQNCIYVTWSTGVGFGLCVDGRILHGKHGNAGHAGHMLMSELEDAVCGCGNRGDLEALISGRNVSKRAHMPTAELFGAARDGDPQARAAAEEAARWLGRALYNLAATLDTRCFAIGGSVWMHHGDWLMPLVMPELSSRFPALTAGVEVRPAALGTVVADIGALSLVIPGEWIEGWRAASAWGRLAS